jgi:hypothetical protein
MKTHTTNYFNTLICVAEDCPINQAEIPPIKKEIKSIANLQFELLRDHPYEFTSDELIFQIFVTRNAISMSEFETAKQVFFSKGQACLRTSPLSKRYAWGIHSNSEGKVALVPSEGEEYTSLLNDSSIAKVFAMKSKR